MAKTNKTPAVRGRRSAQAYDHNPSVGPAGDKTKYSTRRITANKGDMLHLIDKDGVEIGCAGFHKIEYKDKTQFIKLYADGVGAFSGITKGAVRLFQLIIGELYTQKGTDMIYVSAADGAKNGMSRSTYQRAVKELLEREFIFASTKGQNWYYINVMYMFNGDRLAFITEYRRRESDKAVSKGQDEMLAD